MLRPSFYSSELSRALAEVVQGISAYALTESDTSSAAADVLLREGIKIKLVLSIAGYEAVESTASNLPRLPRYETLEALLSAISPIYAKWHAEELAVQLERLSRAGDSSKRPIQE